MAVRYATGFERGATRPGIDLSGTTQSISATNKITGNYSLRCNPADTETGYALLNFTDTGGTAQILPSAGFDSWSVRFYAKFVSFPSTNTRRFFEIIRSSDLAQVLILQITSTGKIRMVDQAGTTTSH